LHLILRCQLWRGIGTNELPVAFGLERGYKVIGSSE